MKQRGDKAATTKQSIQRIEQWRSTMRQRLVQMKSRVISVLVVPLLMLVASNTVQAETYYFHNDQLGTPQVVTDDSRQVVWKGEYDPFGKVTETTNHVEQNLRFPGQYYDEETGLHYNYFRTYDPENGRYVESDPIGLDGGLSSYGYAYQNSIRNIDPMGKAVWFFVPFVAGSGTTTVGGGITAAGASKALLGGAALASLMSIPSDTSTDTSCPTDSCSPCRTITGRIVPIKTLGYRPLDVIPDDELQHGVYGSHHNIFEANQIPFPNCDCFWAKRKYVLKPNQLTGDMVPVEPFAN